MGIVLYVPIPVGIAGGYVDTSAYGPLVPPKLHGCSYAAVAAPLALHLELRNGRAQMQGTTGFIFYLQGITGFR